MGGGRAGEGTRHKNVLLKCMGGTHGTSYILTYMIPQPNAVIRNTCWRVDIDYSNCAQRDCV